MKIILFLISFSLLASLFFVKLPSVAFANPRCINFTVKITAKNYPGGPLQIGCPGDAGPQCVGQVIKNVRPGHTYKLGKCSCFPGNNGCLALATKLHLGPLTKGKKKVIVDKPIPAKCDLTNKKKFCGSNGRKITANFKLVCTKSPTPTPTQPITPTPTDTITPTPSISPTPTICVGPTQVTNVKVTCPNCFSETDLKNFYKK